jgi:hypothetical protein
MTSSQMAPNAYRTVYTNSTLKDNQSQTGSASILSRINSSEVVLRGYKNIWIPDLSNPQNLSVEINIKALGGPVSGIALSDYLPQGALIADLNVTYYNQTDQDITELANGTDFYVSLDNPTQDTLPDGTHVDVYYYNFSYLVGSPAWDGNLYDNDSINITYNVSVLGGGEWVLPAIIAGYDPEYQKNIRTEMYADANVPSFDVVLEMLTEAVRPGEMVKALLRILNVGGPRAKVDVFVTYSAKTMQGKTIADRSETLAVVEQKEKSLELPLPENTEPGIYVFESFVTYTGREALSTGTFTVEAEPGKSPLEQYGLYIALMAVIVVLALMYMRATKERRRPQTPSGQVRKASARPSLTLMLILALLMAALAAAPIALSQSITSGVEVVSKEVEPGEEVKAVLKITNGNYTGYRTDVFVTYSIYGPSGSLVKSESATFPVLDSRDIVLSLPVPDGSPAGAYSFRAEVEHPGGVQQSADSFSIGSQEDASGLYIVTLPVIAAVLVIVLVSRRRR